MLIGFSVVFNNRSVILVTTVSGCDREFKFVEEQNRSKESRVRAIENNQYVNGSTDMDAGADCRLILRFVILFLLIFVEVCIRPRPSY